MLKATTTTTIQKNVESNRKDGVVRHGSMVDQVSADILCGRKEKKRKTRKIKKKFKKKRKKKRKKKKEKKMKKRKKRKKKRKKKEKKTDYLIKNKKKS